MHILKHLKINSLACRTNDICNKNLEIIYFLSRKKKFFVQKFQFSKFFAYKKCFVIWKVQGKKFALLFEKILKEKSNGISIFLNCKRKSKFKHWVQRYFVKLKNSFKETEWEKLHLFFFCPEIELKYFQSAYKIICSQLSRLCLKSIIGLSILLL